MLGGQLVAVAVVCLAAGLYYYRPGSPLRELRGAGELGRGGLDTERRGGEPRPLGEMASPVTIAGSKLFKAVTKAEKGNVAISPMSIVVAMSMAAAGATEGSATATEIREAMGHGAVGGDEKKVHSYFTQLLQSLKSSDPKVEINVANSVWAKGDVKADFKATCQEAFGAQSFDLAGMDPVNEWVDKATQGKIKQLLAQDPLGPAVLLNAVYFKGEWTQTFDKEKTVAGKFRKFDGSEQDCMLMKKDDKKAAYSSTPHAHVLTLPYGNKRFVGVVALPMEEGEGAMTKAIDSLFDTDAWGKVTKAAAPEHVILQLPRFKVDFGASLKPVLEAIGVKEGFQQNKGFLRMTDDPSVFIDDVIHKAVIEVNEQGTEAAAATAVVMTRSLPPPATMMVCDRPFIFAVHDTESNSLLFAAKVNEIVA